MTEVAYSSTRKLLVQSGDLIALVPLTNIRIGFTPEPDSYPCITLTQVAGSTFGYTGHGTSPKGSKLRRDDHTFQIDIYTRSGVLNLEQIADQVDKALMSGTGYRKVSDNDYREEYLNANRKIQTWTFWNQVED